MKFHQLLKLSALATTLCIASCNETDICQMSPNSNQQPIARNKVFDVTQQMLNRYLKLTHQKESVKKIEPIYSQIGISAYLVTFNNGWKLISGDTRRTPVLAFANDGTIDLHDATDPNVGIINGIVNDITEIKTISTDTIASSIWKSISQNDQAPALKPKKATARGIGMGMWIAKDTVYENTSSSQPHIIQTSWGGGNPYNWYMPYVTNSSGNLVNSVVGCVAVASGQVIYHFRKDNPRDIKVPYEATLPNVAGMWPTFTASSVDAWSLINKYHANTSMFLALIAQKVDMNYGEQESPASAEKIKGLLTEYLLNYDATDKYDYYKILSSLTSKRPVIASGSISGDDYGHVFIIDSYRQNGERLVIRYEWDPSHRITEEEAQLYPQWYFSDDAGGKGEQEIEICNSENTYFAMNWGTYGSSNNVYYIAREYESAVSGEDFAGQYNRPGKNIIHTPNWVGGDFTVNGVKLLIYNIREL